MSRSLILIATDTPPLIPANTRGPALRILRLTQPLAAHDAGALRLVSLFEHAQRVAHLWPRDSFPHTIQLAQPSPDGDFSIIETVSYAHTTEDPATTRRYPSPTPSTAESVSSSKWRSSWSPRKKIHCTKSPLYLSDDNGRFDAIINFLPHGLPDKSLLKHAILVTTLGAHFIAPHTHISSKAVWKTCPSHSSTNGLSISSPSHSSTSFPSSVDTSPCPSPPSRRFSNLAKVKNRLSFPFHAAPPLSPLQTPEVSDINQSLEGPLNLKNTHLVHVLPLGWSPDSGAESQGGPRRASSASSTSRQSHSANAPDRTGGTCNSKLVQSIEQFLLSFAYPLGRLVSSSSSGSVVGLSSNLNQRSKSALVLSSTYEKEDVSLASTPHMPPDSTSNLTNINTQLKPVPYLLAPGVFGSCIVGSGRSDIGCSLPYEDDPERSHDQDTRADALDAYVDVYSTDSEATELTIGEIILFGALDFDHTRPGTRPGNGRVWIEDVGDVVVAGGSPGSRKVEVGKGKGREVAVVNNTEMMKTTKRNLNGLPSRLPESSSSNNSAESVEEEQEEEINSQMYARRIPPTVTLSTYSSLTHLDDYGSRSTPNTRSKISEQKSSSSIISTPPPTPVSTILNSKQMNNTSDKRFSDSLSSPSPLPLPSPVQLPALVIPRDRARSPRGSEDNYDLGLGHGIPVPPMIVSMKPGSRSASGSGLGSAMMPLQTRGDDAFKSRYGETRSPKKGSASFVDALRKMGLWKNFSKEGVGVGLKA